MEQEGPILAMVGRGAKYSPPPLPRYSGDPKKMLVAVWRFRARQHFTMAAIYCGVVVVEQHQVVMCADQFKGRAAAWWTSRIMSGDIPETMDGLEQALKTYFELDAQRIKQLRKSYRTAQQKGSVSAYNDYFNDLVVQIPELSEEQKVFDYVCGLKEEIAIKVEETDPETLSEAMSTALDKERYTTKRETRHFQVEHHPRGQREKRGEQRFQGASRTPRRSTGSQKDKSQVICFSCSKPGHYANECPSRSDKKKVGETPKPKHAEENRRTYLRKVGKTQEPVDTDSGDE